MIFSSRLIIVDSGVPVFDDVTGSVFLTRLGNPLPFSRRKEVRVYFVKIDIEELKVYIFCEENKGRDHKRSITDLI